jgi:hypothetical protein
LELESVIESVKASGGTEVVLGLKTAIDVLAARRITNTVTSVMLLTDGQDNYSATALQRAFDLYAKSDPSIPAGYTVHCFGYGGDHDAYLLSQISARKDGEFHYVHHDDSIAECFSD